MLSVNSTSTVLWSMILKNWKMMLTSRWKLLITGMSFIWTKIVKKMLVFFLNASLGNVNFIQKLCSDEHMRDIQIQFRFIVSQFSLFDFFLKICPFDKIYSHNCYIFLVVLVEVLLVFVNVINPGLEDSFPLVKCFAIDSR